MEGDEKVTRLRDALRNNSQGTDDNASGGVHASGEGVAVGHSFGDNNVVQIFKNTTVITRTLIDPRGGELTPAQKQHLKSLVDGVVAVSKVASRPTTHQAVWSRFQKNFKVNTYHALPVAEYDRAVKYLRMLYGRTKGGRA